MRQENTTISVAKGIGICLVLIGHFVFIPEVKRFIYLFHMPLFFFISGYLFSDKEIKQLPQYICKKIKSLYVPFILCNFIALPFHNRLCKIGVYKAEEMFFNLSQVVKHIVKIFLCIKMEDIVAPLWFLPILMVVSIMYCTIRVIIKNARKEKLYMFIIALTGYIIAYFLIYSEKNYSLWRAMILVGVGYWLFHLGQMYRKNENTIRSFCHNKIVVLACLIAEIWLSFIVDVNMIQMRFSDPILYTVCALLGINVILFLSELINTHQRLDYKFLRYIGNSSLTVLEWHYWGGFVTTLLQSEIYQIAARGIVFYQGSIKWLWFLTYCITGLGLPMLMLQTQNKWMKNKSRLSTQPKL